MWLTGFAVLCAILFWVGFIGPLPERESGGGGRRRRNDLTQPHIKIWHKTYLTILKHCVVCLFAMHSIWCASYYCLISFFPLMQTNCQPLELMDVIANSSFFGFVSFSSLLCLAGVFIFGGAQVHWGRTTTAGLCVYVCVCVCVCACVFANELHLIQHIHYITRNWDLV